MVLNILDVFMHYVKVYISVLKITEDKIDDTKSFLFSLKLVRMSSSPRTFTEKKILSLALDLFFLYDVNNML